MSIALEHQPNNTGSELLQLRERVAQLERENATLRAEQQHWRTLVDQATMALFLYDCSRPGFVFVNEWFAQLVGYSAETLCQADTAFFHAHLHPDDWTISYDAFIRWQEAGAPGLYEGVYRMRHASGEWRWFQVIDRAVSYTSDGSPHLVVGSMQDITLRKQSIAALSQSEAHHRAVIANLHEGVIIVDAEGTVVACNSSVERMLRRARSELIGQKMPVGGYQLINEQDRPIPVAQSPIHSSLRTGQPCRDYTLGLYWIEARDTTWLLVNTQPLLQDDTNDVYAVVVSFTDITERKQTERRLSESQMLLQSFLDNIPVDACVYDHDGRVLLANKQVAQRKGQIAEQLIGVGVDEVCVEHCSDISDQPMECEIDITTPEGERTYLCTRFPLHDVSGEIYAFGCVGVDVTERKEREQLLQKLRRDLEIQVEEQTIQLWQQRTLLEGIINNCPATIIVKDLDGRCLLMNQFAQQQWDLTAQDVVGANEAESFPVPEHKIADWQAADRHVLGSERPLIYEDSVQIADGEEHTYLSIKFPLFDKKQQIYAIGIVSTDITERKRFEEELQASEERYREILGVISDYIYSYRVEDDGTFTIEWDMLTMDGGIVSAGTKLTYADMMYATHPADLPKAHESLQETLNGNPGVVEIRHLQQNGDIRWVRAYNQPVRDERSGRVVRFYGAVQEITAQKQHEIMLERYAEQMTRLRELDEVLVVDETVTAVIAHSLPVIRQLIPCQWVGVALTQHSYEKQFWIINGSSMPLQHTLFSAEPLFGNAICTVQQTIPILPTSPLGIMLADLLPALRQMPTEQVLNFPLVMGGNPIGHLLVAPPTNKAFAAAQLLTMEQVARQLTGFLHRALLFEELQSSHAHLRSLARQTTRVQEEERRRLSRELHDEIGQSLTALLIHLQLVQAELIALHPELAQRLGDTVQLADETLDQLRMLARRLRPAVLDTLGLSTALEEMCNRFAHYTNLPIQFVGAETNDLSEEEAICLYRFVQEALTNVARHAEAGQVWVTLNNDAEQVSVMVEDDGRGMPLGSWDKIQSGIGLYGMHERLKLLDGTLEIDSSPQQGTRLIATIRRQGVNDDTYSISRRPPPGAAGDPGVDRTV